MDSKKEQLIHDAKRIALTWKLLSQQMDKFFQDLNETINGDEGLSSNS